MSDDPHNPFEESAPLQGWMEQPPDESRTPMTPKPASAGFSGMDWLGNDTTAQPITNHVTESGRRPGSGPRPHRHRDRSVLMTVTIAVTTSVVVVTATVVGVLWARPGSNPHRTGSRPVTSGTPPSLPSSGRGTPVTTGDCLDDAHNGVVTGTAVGGTDSSLDAIFWFQHSYYVERSGVRAREVVAPDAAVTSAEEIQRGIDSVPYGTRYCVRITPASATQFHVALTEARPLAQPETYREIITTATRTDGRTAIIGIAGE